MTSTENTTNRAGVEAALAALHSAVDDIPVEGFTGRDLAEALLEMAVMAADRGVGRAGVARRLIELAERLFASDPERQQQPAKHSAEAALGVLNAAVETLLRAGQSELAIRHNMLAFVAGWTARAEGPKGAEVFYRYGDGMIGKPGAACH